MGTLIGAGTGYLIGVSDGDDELVWFSYSKEEKGVMGLGMIGAAGDITGAIIGARRKKMDVKYDLERYLNYLDKIRSYSIVHQISLKEN